MLAGKLSIERESRLNADADACLVRKRDALEEEVDDLVGALCDSFTRADGADEGAGPSGGAGGGASGGGTDGEARDAPAE